MNENTVPHFQRNQNDLTSAVQQVNFKIVISFRTNGHWKEGRRFWCSEKYYQNFEEIIFISLDILMVNYSGNSEKAVFRKHAGIRIQDRIKTHNLLWKIQCISAVQCEQVSHDSSALVRSSRLLCCYVPVARSHFVTSCRIKLTDLQQLSRKHRSILPRKTIFLLRVKVEISTNTLKYTDLILIRLFDVYSLFYFTTSSFFSLFQLAEKIEQNN